MICSFESKGLVASVPDRYGSGRDRRNYLRECLKQIIDRGECVIKVMAKILTSLPKLTLLTIFLGTRGHVLQCLRAKHQHAKVEPHHGQRGTSS
jgi:hypothetical protein